MLKIKITRNKHCRKKESKWGECGNEALYMGYSMCSIFKWDCPNLGCDDRLHEICSTEQIAMLTPIITVKLRKYGHSDLMLVYNFSCLEIIKLSVMDCVIFTVLIHE